MRASSHGDDPGARPGKKPLAHVQCLLSSMDAWMHVRTHAVTMGKVLAQAHALHHPRPAQSDDAVHPPGTKSRGISLSPRGPDEHPRQLSQSARRTFFFQPCQAPKRERDFLRTSVNTRPIPTPLLCPRLRLRTRLPLLTRPWPLMFSHEDLTRIRGPSETPPAHYVVFLLQYAHKNVKCSLVRTDSAR